jgi:tetratricopeptide (TPR) repeat protein
MKTIFRGMRRGIPAEELIPVPAELPPLEGLHAQDAETGKRRRRIWRWTLAIALLAALLVVFVLTLAALGIYSGLKDRAVQSSQMAQEHYALAVRHMDAGEYELAVAEFELARHYDPQLADVEEQLRKAKETAQAQLAPTSEVRRDAVTTLYRRAVGHYENGELEQAITALTELRGLDADYQRKNVETLLVTAQYQLALNAVREDRLDDAGVYLQAVLDLKLDPALEAQAQDQLNLLKLYKAALSHWEQDWPAAIQALKGLYALAPDYKDVQARLHDAHMLHGQAFASQGEWCQAAQEYASAVEVFPLEQTVDQRDDAAIQCQLAAEASTPAPTSQALATTRPTSQPAGSATAAPGATPSKVPAGMSLKGRIVYPNFDAVLQRRDLFSLDLSKGTSVVLLENATQPAAAPAGGRLAFRNLDPSHLGLGILDLRTNQVTDLTAYAEDSAPSWSADSGQIVFASNKEGDRRWRIYGIASWEVRGESQQWAYGEMPAWSPDGAEIAYRGCDLQGNNCGLWVMEPNGLNQVRLTAEPSDTAPDWRPDGAEIAFISSRAGNWELYAVDVATGKERRLTNHPGADVAPTWSPDGKRIAFLSNRDGSWGVYILEVKSGVVQKAAAAGDPYPDAVSERLEWTW